MMCKLQRCNAATLQLKSRVRTLKDTLDSLLKLLSQLQYSAIAIADLESMQVYIKALPDGALKTDLIAYFRVMRSKAYEKINSIDIET